MNDLELIFRTAHRQLKPRTPVPEMRVGFFPFAGLNHTARLHEGILTIRVSDIVADAPSEVYQSLALILLAKLYRKKVHAQHHQTYRLFILRGEIQDRAREVRHSRSREVRVVGSRGQYVDLDQVFNRLNAQYFQGLLRRPHISWSAKRSRCVLGRYDSTHNVIFVSRVFDSPVVPTYVIDYILFHEMLHVKHRAQVHHSRILVHTPEFKVEERGFPDYGKAKLWLKGL